MRRMLSEEQLKKKILQYAPGGEGSVTSVNTKTGDVVLNASDILVTNAQSVQANLERIDSEVEGVIDDLADKQDALPRNANGFVKWSEGAGDFVIDQSTYIGYTAGDLLRLDLTKIPESDPLIEGAVYRDAQGNLKVSLEQR